MAHQKKDRHFYKGVPIFFVVHGTTSNPAHIRRQIDLVHCANLRFSLFFCRFSVRLGSHTASGGILRRAALFVLIDIRGTLCTNIPRAADSRTRLRFGFLLSSD